MTRPALSDFGGDPLLSLSRQERLSVHRAWFQETVYGRDDAAEFYPVKEDEALGLRVPTARIITNRHLGLEIMAAPQFKLPNEAAQKWLARILKLNGVRGTMRAAAVTKSWAGDVGVLFAYKPSERDVFGTPWQVGFIEPETYEVHSRYPSGVFREVDIYDFEDRPDKNTGAMRRYWTRIRYSRETLTTWPEVEGVAGQPTRPTAAAFEEAAITFQGLIVVTPNTLGVIPFALIQNVSGGTHGWAGVSDYQHLTQLFHRLNVHLNSVEQGEQIRNRLMMAIIDGEEIEVSTTAGLTALEIKSNQDGTDDRQAQLLSTPLLGQPGTQLAFFSALFDLVAEAAGVAQTGSARELFGNEAASSSALKTFYAMQTAVAQHKRENWLGERADYGLSALVRKLLVAARRVDPVGLGLPDGTDLDSEDFDLTLDWPAMFALSAPEQQTLASVAQQANDEGLPAQHIAPLWAQVLGASSLKAQREISAALTKRQAQQDMGGMLRPAGTSAARGILGSGQGDGLGTDGGSVTATATPP